MGEFWAHVTCAERHAGEKLARSSRGGDEIEVDWWSAIPRKEPNPRLCGPVTRQVRLRILRKWAGRNQAEVDSVGLRRLGRSVTRLG